MSNNHIVNLCNLFKMYLKKKVSLLKIKYCKKNLISIQILLQEGFIRGFYIQWKNFFRKDENYGTIFVLLKCFDESKMLPSFHIKHFLIRKNSFVSYDFLKKNLLGFDFVILSSRKGIISSSKASTLKLGGKLLLKIN